MDDRIQRYLAYAREAEERAAKALDPKAKANWLDAAKQWRDLVEIEKKKNPQS